MTGRRVERHFFGRTADGVDVEQLSLTDATGMRVDVLTFGGAIRSIWVPDRDGRHENVVLALPDLAAQERDPFFGAIIGRYANRLSGGGVVIEGVFHPLDAGDDGIILHGGYCNFSNVVWHAVVDDEVPAVTLSRTSADGESGFPGNLDVSVRYELLGDFRLSTAITARTDRTTVVNIATHPYFNLAQARHSTIEDHVLQILADRFTPIGPDQLPTGEIATVAGTALDFRDPSRLGNRLRSRDAHMLAGGGINHNFVLSTDRRDEPRTCAILHEPSSGRRLDIETDQPGLQVYTANAFDASGGNGGADLPRHAAVALECQHFPDSPKHPHFPSTILKPRSVFRSRTMYRFSVA